jgi:hypothetical protein
MLRIPDDLRVSARVLMVIGVPDHLIAMRIASALVPAKVPAIIVLAHRFPLRSVVAVTMSSSLAFCGFASHPLSPFSISPGVGIAVMAPHPFLPFSIALGVGITVMAPGDRFEPRLAVVSGLSMSSAISLAEHRVPLCSRVRMANEDLSIRVPRLRSGTHVS